MKDKYRLGEGFISRKIGSVITIFSGQQNKIYTLNETAAFIFSGLKRKLEAEEIAKIMANKYNITIERSRKDVKKMIVFFVARKILVLNK
jgi:predicted transcriptional regulator